MVVRYRLNGGQVLGVSTDNTYAADNTTYYGALVDPVSPDGLDLTVPKVVAAGQVRNATAQEIANFSTAEAADNVLIERDNAILRLQTDKDLRRLLRAILGLTVTQINLLRSKIANNSNPATPMTQITEAAAVNAVITAIRNGTYD